MVPGFGIVGIADIGRSWSDCAVDPAGDCTEVVVDLVAVDLEGPVSWWNGCWAVVVRFEWWTVNRRWIQGASVVVLRSVSVDRRWRCAGYDRGYRYGGRWWWLSIVGYLHPSIHPVNAVVPAALSNRWIGCCWSRCGWSAVEIGFGDLVRSVSYRSAAMVVGRHRNIGKSVVLDSCGEYR